MKYVNGNRNRNGIKIGHYNKGHSMMQSRMFEIKDLVSTHQPHILGISEANIKRNEDLNTFSIDDYNLYVGPSSLNGIIRIAVYIHKSTAAKLRPDLMSQNLHSIWLEVSIKNSKKILVNQSYREWQQLGVPNSVSIPDQYARWIEYLEYWEKALQSGMETVCMGDYNINHCNWTNPDIPRENQTYKLRSLITALFTKIFPFGVVQLISGPTRYFPGCTPSGLDHLFTNVPEKITNVQKHFHGTSDHQFIVATRISKSIKSSPQYIRKRSYKNVDSVTFIEAVKSIRWLDLYLSEDVNEAVKIFTCTLRKILDHMAPMKTIQIRKNYIPWISEETKRMIVERNELKKIASMSGHENDWANYKN